MRERVVRNAGWLIAALAFAVIFPGLSTGWIGDDAFYSTLNGVLSADHESLVRAMVHSFDLWFYGNGRFYPLLIVEKYLVFSLFTNVVAYKLLLAAATLGVIELFRRTVAAYTNVAIGNLAALIVAASCVERAYQDPILAYNAMPQMVAALMLASLWAFRGWNEQRSARVLSVVCYLLAALTYEDVFTLAALYPLIAWLRGERGTRLLRSSLPFAIIACGLAAFALAMRAAVHLPSNALYAASFAVPAFARTAWYQISAALPLSYWLFDPQGIFDRSNLISFYRNAPISPFVVLAFIVAGIYFVRDAMRSRVAAAPLAAVGAAALVLPAIPIAATLKYQHELRLGLGYLPVFFELFGTALVATALILRIGRRGATRTTIAVTACVIALVAGMAQAQLRHGLAAGVSDGSFIAIAPQFDWIVLGDGGPDGIGTRGMFYLQALKRVTLVAPGDARARYLLTYDERQQRWTLRRAPLSSP
ncbi:MAG: hypothetical protein KGN02_10190 [bacterium]|nr:hypothetical protein [bacterium]